MTSWVPRYSGTDQLAGCMWLPRMIDKARRYEASGVAPGAMLGDYMFGNQDYMDAILLRFLGLEDTQICEVVHAEPDDERAARRIVELSGKTAADVAAFNRKLVRGSGLFMLMMDADEGRRKPGIGVNLMRAVYNTLIFPIGKLMYRSGPSRIERNRKP